MEINNIYNIDCNKGMNKMIKGNQKVDLIIADPPFSQADEMRRYVDENNKRDAKINPNKWWENFPKLLNRFNFMFVSSEFNGQFEEKLSNIANTTGINGAAMNAVNLLLFAENIKSEFIGLEQAYDLMTKNSEIKIIDAK